ncbi:MAG: Nif3-like dinuclear metal center hexameric protein [Planctomycetota bacterium]
MSVNLDRVCQYLAQIAPLALAEDWDNVGLLLGDRTKSIERVMTCLTVTPSVVAEARRRQVGLVVSHHPIPFRPVKRVTNDSSTGDAILKLLSSEIAVYSAHTAFDSAGCGINQLWAESLCLDHVRSIQPPAADNALGAGRHGVLEEPTPAIDVLRRCAIFVGAENLRGVGDFTQPIRSVGFACGSGGSFVGAAKQVGCELLITGEATFHDCLAAETQGLLLGMLGHYRSERFAMEQLAASIQSEFDSLEVWPSADETDPVERFAL